MYKLASYSYDVLDYLVNNDIDELSDIVSGLSKVAQKAEIPDVDEISQRNESDFALIINHPTQGEMRKFAKFSPELVEININILSKKAEDLPEQILKVAATNLVRAARDYKLDVPENLSSYESDYFIDNHVDVSDIEKTAGYSDILDDQGGPFALESNSKYPIRSSDEIEKAAEYFDLHHRIFDMDEKLEYARNLVKHATGLNIDLSDRYAWKYADLNSSEFNSDFSDHIGIREDYLPDNSENEGIYMQLLEKSAELGPERTMQALAEVDKKTGVWTSWGKGVADPLLSTYGNIKQAGEMVEGKFVTQADLNSIADEDLTPVLGNSFTSDLKSNEGMAILKSLPRPVQIEVLKLIP